MSSWPRGKVLFFSLSLLFYFDNAGMDDLSPEQFQKSLNLDLKKTLVQSGYFFVLFFVFWALLSILIWTIDTDSPISFIDHLFFSAPLTLIFVKFLASVFGSIMTLMLTRFSVSPNQQRTSENRLMQLRYQQLEKSSEGILFIDANGAVEYFNDSFGKMLNRSLAEIRGTHLQELGDARLHKAYEHHMENLYSSSLSYEVEFKTGNAPSVVARFSPIPYIDEKGAYKGSHAIVTDISSYIQAVEHAEDKVRSVEMERKSSYDRLNKEIEDRKKTESHLSKNLALNDAITTFSRAILSGVINIEDISGLILSRLTRITSCQFGYVATISPEDGTLYGHTLSGVSKSLCMLGENPTLTFQRNSDGTYNGLWGHSLNTRSAFFTNDPSNHPASDGCPRGHAPIDSYLSVPVILGRSLVGQISLANAKRPFDDSDLETTRQVARFFALAIQHNNHEKELSNALKMAKSANEAKSKFLADLSHQIRTPMNSIIGLCEAALQGNMPDEEKSCIKSAKESAASLLYLVNEVVDLTRIESGELTLKQQDVNLSSLIQNTIEPYAWKAKKKGVSFQLNIAESFPKIVSTDPSRIRQILINLISNAIKFTDAGYIEVVAEPLNAHEDNSDCVMFLSVKDTGIGIPEDKIEHVFEMSEASTDMTRMAGSGIGLHISKRLVELMNGEIWFESELGKGSIFSLRIPLKVVEDGIPKEKSESAGDTTVMEVVEPAPEESPEGAEPAEKEVRRKLRVLLVEDNPDNRMMAEILLKRQGMEIVSATNGAEGVNALHGEKFDLVLMDIQMPIMDGLEAARKIRNDQSGDIDRDIPIIAVTAHALKGDKERFLLSGMNDYVSKPIDMPLLLSKIESILHLQRETDPSKDGD